MNTIQPSDLSARQEAINVSDSFLIMAPAGSGKTEILTQRFLKCLSTANRPEEVLFLTFTNKAVKEGYERITDALARGVSPDAPESAHEKVTWDLARQVLGRNELLGWNLLSNPNRLKIMTFDSLNAQLAAQLPVLSGFGGPSSVDENALPLYKQAIHNLFEELKTPSIELEVKEALTKILVFAQNRIESLSPLLCGLLASRDQWLGQLHHQTDFDMEQTIYQLITDSLSNASSVLGQTTSHQFLTLFSSTDDPAHEIFSTLPSMPDPIPENLNIWRSLADNLLVKSGNSRRTLRKKVTKANGFIAKKPHTIEMNELLSSFQNKDNLEEIEEALTEVTVLPDLQYPQSLDEFRIALSLVLNRLVAHLRVVFESAGKVDFIEVALRASAALGEDDAINDALLKMDYVMQHLLLDEAQDISYSQYLLIQKLTSGWNIDDGRSLCLVGDPQQSIYAFRQAEVRLFMELWQAQEFSGIPLKRLRLSANFRSEKRIIDWFNDAFEAIFPNLPDLYRSAVTFSPSTSVRPDLESTGVFIHPLSFSYDRSSEPKSVTDQIKTLRSKYPNDSIAILVRSRTHVRDIIPVLQKENISISSQNMDPLLLKPAVSDFVCLIRALWHPYDRTSWVGLLRAPFVGLSLADLVYLLRGHPKASVRSRLGHAAEIDEISAEGKSRISRLVTALTDIESDRYLNESLPRKVAALWCLLGGPACITTVESNDLETLMRMLEQHCQAGELLKIDDFLHSLSGLYASADAGDVQILTIHGSKGLEFDHVICPGLDRQTGANDTTLLHYKNLPGGYLIAPNPGKYSNENSPAYRLYKYMDRLKRLSLHQESMRLLYVAVTRARKTLHLFAQVKPNAKDGTPTKPHASSFLSLLWPVVSDKFAHTQTTDTYTSTRQVTRGPVITPRLTLDWTPPAPDPTFIPKVNVALLPSEMVLSENPSENGTFNESEEIVPRLIGTMYHAFMDHISKDGLTDNQWDHSKINQQRDSLLAGCRRMGMPEPRVDEAVDNILMLAHNTIDCEKGRWILDEKDLAFSEKQLSGFVNGKWVAAYIDRGFLFEDYYWIIDYKTGGIGLQTNEITEFVQRETLLYKPQLDRYKELVQLSGCRFPIRSGLYFPALKMFAEV